MITLLSLPHCEAKALVRTGAPVFLTVNPVEYHGPHLSLHNDRLVSRGLAHDIHARLAVRHPEWPFIVAEDLEVGVGPTPGLGTRVLDYPTVARMVIAACRGLLDLGARRIVLLTFHGEPLHMMALARGVEFVRQNGAAAVAPFDRVIDDMLRFDEVFDLDSPSYVPAFEHIQPASLRERVKASLRFDFHAGFFETSVAMHYAPQSVSQVYRDLPPCPPLEPHAGWSLASRALAGLSKTRIGQAAGWSRRGALFAEELRFAATAYGWQSLRPFPGYTGWPNLATPAAGAVFASYLADRFSVETERVLLGEKAPEPPPLAWADTLSFGGRIGQLQPLAARDLATFDDLAQPTQPTQPAQQDPEHEPSPLLADFPSPPQRRATRSFQREGASALGGSSRPRKILSLSLGARSRDHVVTTEFAGIPFELRRAGTDGDFAELVRQFRIHDGCVDAFGLGGAVLFLELGERRYYFRDCKKIRRAVKHTRLADGNGIKHLLEARAVELLAQRIGPLRGRKAFVMSGADRYGQARALFDAGCDTVAGDLIFTMGLDVPVRSLRGVEQLGALILPPALQLPFQLYYPTGEEQEKPPVHHPRFTRYYEEAEIIAGDYLWLRKYMPRDMSGKYVLTNTTTRENVEELKARGVKLLITSTPRLDGRSFGTNVLEAMVLCLIDKPEEAITTADFAAAVQRAQLEPQVEVLN